ncbi:hypothetical protein [Senegalia massiliensis]|uniref:hypothetical protein n=1 Tax=Senegalia massiliensis TaxID=1720316 RepID=UPI0010307504|nr:hypothetical protein [Senegalia massiliensis]
MIKTILIKLFKIILFLMLIFFIVLAGFIFYIDRATRPTPEHERNISETNVKIEVDINDKSETRNPIIRTYKEEKYKKFNKIKIRKIMDTISGNIEGDIPRVHLRDDKDVIYISFIKNEEEVEPNYMPKIEIEVPESSSDTSPYNTENNRIINDKLEYEDGKYRYKLNRYRTQQEKYFMHYNIIRIYYQVDGEKYISTFGLNASNAEDGVDFFNNESLDKPKEPER